MANIVRYAGKSHTKARWWSMEALGYLMDAEESIHHPDQHHGQTPYSLAVLQRPFGWGFQQSDPRLPQWSGNFWLSGTVHGDSLTYNLSKESHAVGLNVWCHFWCHSISCGCFQGISTNAGHLLHDSNNSKAWIGGILRQMPYHQKWENGWISNWLIGNH